MTKGGKNLVILGVSAVLIATVTTCISLVIYHNSGDIYIDRSRPGFLPDEAEIEENENEPKSDYVFSENGEIDAATIREYLDNLSKEVRNIDAVESPFDARALSDEKFGL